VTKEQVRDFVRNLIDDPNAKRWTDTLLDMLIGMVYDELWSDILDAAPWYNSKLETLSVNSPGYINVASDLDNRFHKVQKLTRAEKEYTFVDQRDVVLQDSKELSAPHFTYTLLGDELYVFPLQPTPDVKLRYSFKPTTFGSLQDSDAVVFPEGHESALLYEAASRALLKGAAEDGSSLLAIARDAKARMLKEIKRRYPGPHLMYLADSSYEWGGT